MPTYTEIQQRPDPVLGRIALGYKNEDAVNERIVPVVNVTDRKGKYPSWGLESFRIQDTRRAPRTKANATDFKVTWLPYDLEEHALDFEYEDKEKEEYEKIGPRALFNMERDGVKTTEDQLQLGREKRAGDLLRDVSLPGVTLAGTAQFNDYTNSDPVAIARQARRAIRRATGKIMNTVLLPFDVDDVLLEHPKLKGFIGTQNEQFVTEDLIRRVFRVQNVITASQIYNLGTDEAPVFADVWGRDIIFAYVNTNPRPNQRELSFAYNFRYRADDGNPALRWRDNNTETNIVRLKYEEKIRIVAPGAGYVVREAIAPPA